MITPGCIELLRRRRGAALSGLVCVPHGHASGWLVSVHGISRRARQHAELMSPVAEALGLALAAPRFGSSRFPGYQRLRAGGPGGAPDLALLRWLEELAVGTGVSADRVVLVGFSGGAQFVHRFALLHPRRVRGYVSVAAGWYTWPSERLRFPHGVRTAPMADLRQWLAIPCRVLVGEDDDVIDPATRQAPRLNRRQGHTRLQRARAWTVAMNAAAARFGLPPPCSLGVLPRCGHSFRDCMTRGGLAAEVHRAVQGWSSTQTEAAPRGRLG